LLRRLIYLLVLIIFFIGTNLSAQVVTETFDSDPGWPYEAPPLKPPPEFTDGLMKIGNIDTAAVNISSA